MKPIWELLKSESSNPQEYYFFFESLDQIENYSSMDRGMRKLRVERGGREKEREKRENRKKLYSKFPLPNTKFWLDFYSAIQNKKLSKLNQ